MKRSKLQQSLIAECCYYNKTVMANSKESQFDNILKGAYNPIETLHG